MSEIDLDEREAECLSLPTLLKFYWPLALSWLFMSMETPLAISILSRTRDEVLNTAAYLPMLAISFFIEGPVIDLLSTATTFGKSRISYLRLRSFSVWLMLWCTVIHAVVALTPVYGWVVNGWLGLKPELVGALRPALVWMIPWSAFIGWRRFRQGILIRSGETRPIGIGTLIRAGTIFGVGLILSHRSLPGIQAIAIALVASVGIEAIFVHFSSVRVVRAELPDSTPDDHQPGFLSMPFLLEFHVPLALTTMLTLSSMQLAAKSLSQTQNSALTMAAWQTAASLVFLHRALTFALPEMVIALATNANRERILRRFCVGIGVALSGLMVLLWITGAAHWIISELIGATPPVAKMAELAFIASAALPILTAYSSYSRGLLTVGRLTKFRLIAVTVSTVSFFVSLEVLVRVMDSGILVPAFSLIVMAIAEVWIQAYFLSRSRKVTAKESTQSEPSAASVEPVSLSE